MTHSNGLIQCDILVLSTRHFSTNATSRRPCLLLYPLYHINLCVFYSVSSHALLTKNDIYLEQEKSVDPSAHNDQH